MEKRKDPRKKLGQLSEEIAAKYLSFKNYEVIAKNFRWERGEGDIFCIAPSHHRRLGGIKFRTENSLVLVEVRSGMSDLAPYLESSIGYEKRKKLRLTFERFLGSKDFYEKAKSKFPKSVFEKRIEVLFVRGVHHLGESSDPSTFGLKDLEKVQITHFPLDEI